MSDDCYVYIVGTIRNGLMDRPVKIGITHNFHARLRAIQTGSPEKVAYVWVFRMPNKAVARYIESCFHETQVDHRLHGEWFAIDPIVAIQLMCLNIRAALEVNLAGWSAEQIDAAYEKTLAREAWEHAQCVIKEGEVLQ